MSTSTSHAWDKLVNPREGITQAEYHLVNEAIVNVMATIKFESWLEAERNNTESINAMSAMQDGLPKLEVDDRECLKLLTPCGLASNTTPLAHWLISIGKT